MKQLAQWFWRRVDDLTYNWNADRQRFKLKTVMGLSVLTAGCILQFGEPFGAEPVADGTQHAWVQLAWLVISIGLSLLAGQMLAKKNDSPIQSDKPTTLTTRGSFTPWHVGIRRIGPVFCWAGGREIRKESSGGKSGKGGGGAPEAEIPYEAGWHVLGIGPMTALHEIIQGGTTIFSGIITNESHPSGSTIDLGKEGAFTIFWGEPDQPINTYLGNSNRVTISSRWPNICYVVWNKKRLTGSVWGTIDYVLERRPTYTGITQSQGWYDPNRVLSGVFTPLFDVNADADEDLGYLAVEGDLTSRFKPTTILSAVGVGIPDGNYEVLRTEVSFFIIGGAGPYEVFGTETRIFLQGGTAGATSSGTLQHFVNDETDGTNVAHIIGELLFANFPQGLQYDPNHLVEKWDLDSLEALGVEAETEEWRAAIMGTQGETAEAMLGSMLQDHGTMLPIDTTSGKLLFQRIRFPEGNLSELPDDIFADRFPEIETIQGEHPVDRLIFSFSDRTSRYGDMTIAVDEDGQAAFSEHQRARKVPLVSTTLFATAAALAELRSPEELAPGAQFRLDVGREARDLLPGQAITVEGFNEVLRVIAVEIDPLSERTQLTLIPDFYGVPLSDFITGEGGEIIPPLDPEPDEAFFYVEIPEQLLANGFGTTQTIIVPRIRAHNQINFSSIYLSRDNATFDLKLTDLNVQTGGALNAALLADGPTYADQSVEFTEFGPDNSAAGDLSADLIGWGLGKQLAIIVSTAGVEVCFLQKTTIISGTTRRLDGLLRARYDTRKLDHPAGAIVFITDPSAITEIQDGLLEPLTELHVKSQPGSSGGQVNLSAIPSVGVDIVGKGQVPITPDYVHVRAPFVNVPAFQTGDDITISWAVSTGTVATGCGNQSSGLATGEPVIPGTLSIELLTVGDVVQDTIAVTPTVDIEFIITNAALVAAFSSEPSAFKVRITHIANGFPSLVSPSLTITRI